MHSDESQQGEKDGCQNGVDLEVEKLKNNPGLDDKMGAEVLRTSDRFGKFSFWNTFRSVVPNRNLPKTDWCSKFI